MCHPQGVVIQNYSQSAATRKDLDAFLQEHEETPDLKSSSTLSRSNSISTASSSITADTVSYDADVALCLVGSGLIRSLRDGNNVDITYTEDNEFQMVGDELAVTLSKEEILGAAPDRSLTSRIPSEISKDLLDILL
mmetsp:Transcript_24088/g.33666  ORF Transcript_24088/g.33666 Transcript_24088/m.33666 type:complete len:137 (+) Transcript_24088:105-515(+)